VAAAEAAEAAAEEAESLGGTEGAARAAAFRREGEAAVAAAAAAAVAAGEQLDELIETMRSAGSLALASPPGELQQEPSHDFLFPHCAPANGSPAAGQRLLQPTPRPCAPSTSLQAAPQPHPPQWSWLQTRPCAAVSCRRAAL
jgi:hypothetical protein